MLALLPDRLLERIELRAAPDDVDVVGPCWLWTASTSRGYGQVRVTGGVRKVHRVVFELLIAPIADGLDLDHLCRVRACCSPLHLEPVTRGENIRRSPRVTKTRCVRGHDISDPSHYWLIRGGRRCKACDAIRHGRPLPS